MTPPPASNDAPRLTTAAGTYRGSRHGGVAVFRGIRYAAEPSGELRWAPPAPPPAFADERAALEPGPACPQPPGWDAPYRAAARLAGADVEWVTMEPGATGEDCLCLDLWTPEVGTSPRLPRLPRCPVMVWIHGGASAFGSGSCAMFDGARLAAEHGVAVVSINYRLGVLGFLAHPELVHESPHRTAGNYGFLDLVAALEWVRDNAHGFGGDPANVTVFGESAGGRAIFELLAHAPAHGLFHRAIAQSPWDEKHHHRRLDERFENLESACDLGTGLAAELGVASGAALDRMRSAATAEVLAAADRLGFAGSLWGPIVDGVVFPDHPLAMIARGETPAVPLILGWNGDEGSIFFLGDLPFPSAETYREYVERTHPAAATELLTLYPPAEDPLGLHRSFSGLYGDRTFAFPGLLAAKAMAHREAAVHLYRFTHVHPPFSAAALSATGRDVGSFHASEIPLVFGTQAGGPIDETDEELGQAMRAYWARFAKTGDPSDGNGGSLPVWPGFRSGEERYLELGDKIVERARPASERYPALARALGPRLGLDPVDLARL